MCIVYLYGKSYAHTRRLQKKLRTQLVVREKIYAKVILQVVVHTSCAHKFCLNLFFITNILC
jgi:hypothetical protein